MDYSYPCNDTRRLLACGTDSAGFTIPQLDVTARVDNYQVWVFSPRHHFIYTSAESRRLCWVG
jgi:hypothetical protein